MKSSNLFGLVMATMELGVVDIHPRDAELKPTGRDAKSSDHQAQALAAAQQKRAAKAAKRAKVVPSKPVFATGTLYIDDKPVGRVTGFTPPTFNEPNYTKLGTGRLVRSGKITSITVEGTLIE